MSAPLSPCIGGGSGIRTHGTLARTTVFETAPFDRSGIPPLRPFHDRGYLAIDPGGRKTASVPGRRTRDLPAARTRSQPGTREAADLLRAQVVMGRELSPRPDGLAGGAMMS